MWPNLDLNANFQAIMPCSFHHACLSPFYFPSFPFLLIPDSMYCSYILVTAHSTHSLTSCRIYWGTTLLELTVCYIFVPNKPCNSLLIILRPFPSLNTSYSLLFHEWWSYISVVCSSAKTRCAFPPWALQVHLDAARTLLSELQLEHSSVYAFPIFGSL